MSLPAAKGNRQRFQRTLEHHELAAHLGKLLETSPIRRASLLPGSACAECKASRDNNLNRRLAVFHKPKGVGTRETAPLLRREARFNVRHAIDPV
jgi:hypothetical protein